jgi:ribonuclease P protein component
MRAVPKAASAWLSEAGTERARVALCDAGGARREFSVRTRAASFPKAARLLKTDEFSSVFRLRPWARTEHFVLYGRPNGAPARLGLVIGKKFAPRAVTRNLVRRLAREAFRQRRAELHGWDIVVRLHKRFDKKALPGAASATLKAICQAEIATLVTNAVHNASRRAANVTPPVTPSVEPE